MDSRQRIGLKLLMWIARHLLDRDLNDPERVELRNLATSLSVMRQEDAGV